LVPWCRWSLEYIPHTGTCFIQKCMSPPLPYFKVNIYPFPFPHFASIFVAYLWSFRWPNYIVTLPRYFPFRLLHLNIPTGPHIDELEKDSQRTWLSENFSHWNGYSHLEFEWVLSENEKDQEIDFGSVERENDLEFINYWRRNFASY
jgi:hypothetical protein